MTAFLLLFPLFLVAVTVHELSHGWAALSLGDDTARRAGRLTLNPLRHLDPVGTVLLPLFLQLIGSPFVFGWAKPVPVNPMNFRHPRRDMLWVGIAGPAANFALALLAAAGIQMAGGLLSPVAAAMTRYLILINLVLGTFNLIPVPPLDGSRVLTGLLPVRWSVALIFLERWGFLLVIGMLYVGLLDRVLWPVVSWMARSLGL